MTKRGWELLIKRIFPGAKVVDNLFREIKEAKKVMAAKVETIVVPEVKKETDAPEDPRPRGAAMIERELRTKELREYMQGIGPKPDWISEKEFTIRQELL